MMIYIDRIDRQTEDEATVTISGPVEDVSALTTGEYPGLEGLTRVIKTVLTLGKPSREDKLTAELAQAQAQATEAAQREQAAQEQAQAKTLLLMTVAEALPDELAVQHKDIYPAWDEVLQSGESVVAGLRLRHEDGLYRVQQEHIPQEHQPPSVNTAALYTAVHAHPGARQR